MAVKSQIAEYRQIMTDIRKGTFAPVYLLMGDEPYYIDRIAETLEEKVVPRDERDFNSLTVYGQDADIPALIAACQQYPFMADRKIVLLKEAQSMPNAKNLLEGLADYVAHPSDMNVLVVVFKGDNLNGNGRLMKAAAKAGAVVFRSPALRDYQLDAPIKEYCQAKRIGIQEKSIAMLKEYIGTSLGKIFGEIDKLIVAGGKDLAQITPELIEKNIGISKDFNNFELTAALAVKNYNKCMTIINYFARNPKSNPTPMVTGILFNFFSKLLTGLLSSDRSESGLMASMDLKNSYQLRDYKAAFRNYTPMQALKAIRSLRRFDAASKGVNSNQNEYELLTELIFNIFAAK